jgi:hypothetical protein
VTIAGRARPIEEVWNIKLSETQILQLSNIQLKYNGMQSNLPRLSITFDAANIRDTTLTNQQRMMDVELFLNNVLQSDAPLLFCPLVRNLFGFDHFRNRLGNFDREEAKSLLVSHTSAQFEQNL